MYKPTRGHIETFLKLVGFGLDLSGPYKDDEDRLYKWLASYCGGLPVDRRLSPSQWKALAQMPVIELFRLLDE
jgi:hypothetical protein